MQSGYIHAFQFSGGCSLHIFQGDLTRVEADALVSSDDNYLSAGGGVSAALARVAGLGVARERERIARGVRPKLGDVVCTSAGGLPCRHLYHAITIDFDEASLQDESSLRRLVANLLNRATEDEVRTLGMPALGAGAALFDLARASEIIIHELLLGMSASSVRRVVLALIGDQAERLFYEQLVRASGASLAARDLRAREAGSIDASRPRSRPEPPSSIVAIAGETVEQVPSLIDEARFAVAAPSQPRLVRGLAEVILKHAGSDEVERELLSRPECHGFRGSVKQRLEEFLYLSEEMLRLALGPALFLNRDLRAIADELGEKDTANRDHDQLVTAILRALCFNIVALPVGSDKALDRTKRLLADLHSGSKEPGQLRNAAVEAGRILEQFLTDLLRLYGQLFWGDSCETELIQRGIIPKRREGSSLLHLTIGQLRQALQQLAALPRQDPALRERFKSLEIAAPEILPRTVSGDGTTSDDFLEALQDVIEARNSAVHPASSTFGWDAPGMIQLVERLLRFLTTCRKEGIYPDVLRYEGTFENRDGERFVHFVDESNSPRKVRTDEQIDPRRHYFCFATNNPLHLYPVLIPKL